MKSLTRHLTLEVPQRMDFVNITSQVADAVRASSVQEGLCLVNAMHITASVFINDDEAGLHEDYKEWLEALAPHDPQRYRHNRTGEDNGDAHHKRQIMGREVVVAIHQGAARFWALGADLLRGVRWAAGEARDDQDHWGVTGGSAFGRLSMPRISGPSLRARCAKMATAWRTNVSSSLAPVAIA